MPRRRKHRKHGKNRQQKGHSMHEHTESSPNTSKFEKNNTFFENTASYTLVSSENTQYSTLDSTPLRATTPMSKINKRDSFELETPIRTNSIKENLSTPTGKTPTNELFDDDCCTPVKTPINKRRSLNRQNDVNKWNVTNLNLLFESDGIVPSSEVCLSGGDKEYRKRSSSSIAKLHSPGKEKPLSVHKSTQTTDRTEPDRDRYQDLITETPRVSQKIIAGLELNKNEMSHTQLNNTRNVSNMLTKFGIEECNINPYIKDKEIITLELTSKRSRYQKEGSVEELSFFSPQLFDKKTSSTPIDRVEGSKLLSFIKENVMKENCGDSGGRRGFGSIMEEGTPHRQVVGGTPRSAQLKDQILNNSFDLTLVDLGASRRSNINLNTPPLTEKIINKDRSNSIKMLGSSKRKNIGASTSRIQNRTSPKMSRLLNHSRLLNKNLSHARLNVSRRSLLENSCELAGSPNVHIGVYEKLINKIKRYSKASAKWSVKMMETCTQLGIQIKNSLHTLCTADSQKSFIECSKTACKCEEYKAEIGTLNVKIVSLSEEVVNVRRQIEEYHNGERNRDGRIDQLNEELVKVRHELSTVTDLRSELTAFKEQFQCFRNAALSAPLATPAAPPPIPCAAPPPPPPPPPPPLPMLTQQKVPFRLGLGKKAKSTLGLGGNERGDSRPAITLDEILKVKLKKASDRPATTPVSRARHSITPVMSQDLLNQVKLRPRQSLPSKGNVSTPAGSATSSSEPSSSTSPHSSLCRILNAGEPVWKVKRLRKVGGYSFDSVHRRSPGKQLLLTQAMKRDRIGS